MIRGRTLTALLSSVAAVACGDLASPARRLTPTVAHSGGGGSTITVSTYNPLPSSPPAPDIIIRESFGPGDSLLRPAGGKGALKTTFTHTTLNGFWVEYPGTKNNAWITPDLGQTWKFCAGTDDNELPSPLQATYGGCVASEWIDPPTSYPTALLPITMALPAAGYELSMDGYPAPIAGGYVAIGFTSSGSLTSNLTTNGLVWLRVVDTTRFGFPLHYELRTGSLASGKILVQGDAGSSGWNPMAIRVSPSTGTVTLTYAGTVVGTYPLSIGTPKYAAFEGIGILDNFVLRQ